jgi:DNA-binding CsgD family transcriptional regulator
MADSSPSLSARLWGGLPLVGRGAELGRLLQLLDRLETGSGAMAVISGEAGIGKSRLVTELAGQAEKRELAVLSGTCGRRRPAPYAPVLEALADRHGERLASLLAGLGSRGQPVTNLLRGGRLTKRSCLAERLGGPAGIYEALMTLLRAAHPQGAVVVVLEDLQWADRATVDFVNHVARRLDRIPVFLAVTYRSGETAARTELSEVVSPSSPRATERIELAPLPLTGTGELAAALLGNDVQPPLAKELHEWSGGNPFFVEELLRDAASRGALRLSSSGWAGQLLAPGTCPGPVALWLRSRLEELAPSARDLLSTAAILGAGEELGLLLAAAESRDPLADLDQLEVAGYLGPDPQSPGRYRFRHPLIRAVIAEQLSLSGRRYIHDRVANALAAFRPEGVAERAAHLVAAGRSQDAVPLQLAAADLALEARAYADADATYAAVLPQVHGPDRGLALCRRGEALRHLGHCVQASALLSEGIGLLEAAGREKEAAVGRLLLGFVAFELGDVPASIHAWERAKVTLEAMGASEALALAYVFVGASRVLDYDPDTALPLIERGLALAEQVDAPAVRAWALNFMGGARVLTGAPGEGLALLDRSRELGAELGLDLVVLRAAQNGGCLRLWALRAQEVEAIVVAAAPWAPGAVGEVSLQHVRAMALAALGKLGRACTLAQAARRLALDSGLGMYVQFLDYLLGQVLADLGRLGEASTHLRGSLDDLLRQEVADRASAQIAYFLASGDPTAAREVARAALGATQGGALEPMLAARAAEAFYAAGSVGDLDSLSALVDSDRCVAGTVWADQVLGRHQLVAGDPEVGRRLAEGAARGFGAAGYRLEEARCHALAAHGAAVSDPNRGLERLARALAMLDQAGAYGVRSAVERAAGRYGLATPASPSPEPNVTARERQILALVAQGRTDAEISVALTISPRTVSSHLDRIREKTGRRRRSELTRLALELSLVPGRPPDGVTNQPGRN